MLYSLLIPFFTHPHPNLKPQTPNPDHFPAALLSSFEGIITPSRSQASFLVFCTLLSLASVALVLTITWPEGGQNWYWITAISPLS